MQDLPASLQLGLIGDNIAASRSPLLHKIAGEQNGMDVSYLRLVPREMDKDFDGVFQYAKDNGYRGINVTYPYKEYVTKFLQVDDPLVRGIGAVNTVIFGEGTPKGHNTDYSGFMSAYRNVRGDRGPGAVLMIGTGGVGRAIAFGLVGLGCTELRLVDRDTAKAEALAADVRKTAPEVKVVCGSNAEALADGAQGIVNCTPVGMVGYDGTPLAEWAMAGAAWAFDAVYTPPNTQFLTDAKANGLDIISGWELFFFQGVHAWKFFCGAPLDEPALRAELMTERTY